MTFLTGFKEGFQDFGKCISAIVNTILLSAVYFLGVGPTSVVGRLLRKRFLELEKQERTYWNDLQPGRRPLEEYYRQF